MLGSLPARVLKKLRLANGPVFDPNAAFGHEPRADRATYIALHEEAVAREYPKMDAFLADRAHSLDPAWMNNLALHTQVVVKRSELNFQHGRMLYALLRDRIDGRGGPGAEEISAPLLADQPVTVLETGTARGFSALCMARAICEAGRQGMVITLDLIPHDVAMYWNCIDDADGPRTRRDLLAPWPEELDRTIFISGDSQENLGRMGLGRIPFAFLDGAHHEEDVMVEYCYVAPRQGKGDVIVFDDVTPGAFDGIVAAIDRIEGLGAYHVHRFQADEARGYAIATKLSD